MAVVNTRYEHVVLDEGGVPKIAGTTMKVVELVVQHQAYGWSPEELHFQHPTLTLGQIYSALAYYWDHQEELDRDIQRRIERVEQFRREAEPVFLKGMPVEDWLKRARSAAVPGVTTANVIALTRGEE